MSWADAGSDPAIPDAVAERLFPAAIQAFAERDFQHVGIRDIAAASGVSSATIYKYVRSKEALLFTILRQALEAIDHDISVAIAGAADQAGAWRAVFAALMRHYDARPDLAVVYFITVPTRTWIAEGSWASFGSVDRLAALAEQGRRSGVLDAAVSASAMTALVFMHCAREVHLWYHHGRRWRLSDRVDHIVVLFWKAVRA